MTPLSHFFDLRPLRAIAVGTAMMLLYGSRLTRGSVRVTPDGPVFTLKPMVTWSRAIGLPAYILFFGYWLLLRQRDLPWWFGSLLMLAIAFAVATLPATIVLGPNAIRQRYWLRQIRSIDYANVAAIERVGWGRGVRVIGTDGVRVVHSVHHCASDEFRREIEQRTGKRAPA